MFKGGLSKGRRIAKGGAKPKVMWADCQAKSFDSLGRLLVAGAAEWHGVEHYKYGWSPSHRDKLLGVGDRLKVVNLRSAGNDVARRARPDR